MKKIQITYIGELPPPYGGVTVKNTLLFEKVFAPCGCKMIDMVECKRKAWLTPIIAFQVFIRMLKSKAIIIGVGSTKRRKILLNLQRIISGKTGLNKIMLIVMGGQFHEQVAEDKKFCCLLKNVGSIWVESETMVNALREIGIEQTYFFPNCRVDEGAKEPLPCQNGKLKLVFFSRICHEKGVDDIITAYERLEEDNEKITLDFYGEIEADIKEDFLKFVEKYKNVHYHGVFDAIHEDIYAELNQYDVMLLISKREGVAGALVESKMSGITAIVSNRGCNPETVHDGKEGIVLHPSISDNLADTIKKLLQDRDMVYNLKKGAYESRKRYCIETYRNIMIDHILG